ncbi:MAG: tRNA preQ1(34) S-adenosylmethionine ribosyltransferase-isomerase QueA [Phycisphaerae bacterium]
MQASFPVQELDYDLPPELIAQQPLPNRDASRLLIVNRTDDALNDAAFTDLPHLLRPGDLLVLNDTKVIPARFVARRSTGGRIEGLFLNETEPGQWEVLLKGARRLQPGETLDLDPPTCGAQLQTQARTDAGRWHVHVTPPQPAQSLLAQIGRTPLPPYIHRPPTAEPNAAETDRDRYQTVFARHPGAVAAPTAGLHFTDPLLDRIRERGVHLARLTLHVGQGTFEPVKVDDLANHTMHAEPYELPPQTAAAVADCRRRSGRVISVGTTALRVLETCATSDGHVQPGSGSTRLFCYPPNKFKVVDALLTNFHLPRSTLLALVMAFAGIDRTRSAYRHAVQVRYRFFSFGDAMLLI